jgi:hypothetical protein
LALVIFCACARAPSKGSPPAPNPAEATVVLRYAEEASLAQTTRFSVEQAGGGEFGRAAFELRAQLGWILREDRREVSWEVVGVDDIDLHGGFALTSDDDPAGDLTGHGKGAWLVDPSGELDDVETARLRANAGFHGTVRALQAGEGSAPTRARVLSLVPVALALPELPRGELALGERTVVEETQEVELEGGLLMPATVTRAHTLVKIDEGGVAPIAEITIELESIGEVEMPDASLSFEGRARGTLLFDVARGLPVAFELSRTETFDFDGRVGESTTLIESVWDG